MYFFRRKVLDSNKKRKVIIHKHLFKNAGTTFDWSLRKNFGTAFCDHRNDMPMREQGEVYLLNFLQEHPEIKALSSHHIVFNFSVNSAIELIPVYILRHPIERIRSVYNFEKIQQSTSLGAIMAKKMNFKEYAAWRMRLDVPATIRDFQTIYCSGIKTQNSLTEYHYKLAQAELEKCNFVGIVDLYGKSMKVFESEFEKLNISVDLSFIPQNVNQSINNVNYEDRAKEVLDELGKLAQEVLDKNQFDLALYNFARERLIRSYQLLKI